MGKVLLCVLVVCFLSSAQQIKSFKPFSGIFIPNGTDSSLIILRSFLLDSIPKLLVVDPATFVSTMRLATAGKINTMSFDSLHVRFSQFPYNKVIAQVKQNEDTLQDAGIKNIELSPNEMVLSIDLCPSLKSMDTTLFTMLMDSSSCIAQPPALELAVSGLWIKKHGENLKWLLSKAQENRLVLHWINHSYYHRERDSISLDSNFFLMKGTNVENEILLQEKLLITNGITPTVFFRFPGLVSNKKLVEKVLKLGLIPVGSNAWLAKGEKPVDGSIILVHGNGNEPYGIQMLRKYLVNKKKNGNGVKVKLVSIGEGIVDGYGEKK
jgi:hypothetical protein